MKRITYLQSINECLERQPICAILGARQVGKTTLAKHFSKQFFKEKTITFDLENPHHIKILENPMATLSLYNDHLIIIDEIQLRPDLFPILRVLVDDTEKKYQFLILGSASKQLIRQSSETLTGRIGYIELPPFTFFDATEELLEQNPNVNLRAYSQQSVDMLNAFNKISITLLARGGFPKSYLAKSDKISFGWREDYIKTFVERDLPSFGFDISPQLMHRFWMMLCFYHGQIFNGAETAHSLMVSLQTVNKYLDILEGTFMIRVLQPWYENIKKRQVRSPKIYIRDSGMFNTLMSIHSIYELGQHPKMGAVWEGFALEQVITCLQISPMHCYFWSTVSDAELDLLIFHNGKRIGFEFKYGDAPKITKSMGIAIKDLQLDHLYIIYPGGYNPYPMDEKITACALDRLHEIKI